MILLFICSANSNPTQIDFSSEQIVRNSGRNRNAIIIEDIDIVIPAKKAEHHKHHVHPTHHSNNDLEGCRKLKICHKKIEDVGSK